MVSFLLYELNSKDLLMTLYDRLLQVKEKLYLKVYILHLVINI